MPSQQQVKHTHTRTNIQTMGRCAAERRYHDDDHGSWSCSGSASAHSLSHSLLPLCCCSLFLAFPPKTCFNWSYCVSKPPWNMATTHHTLIAGSWQRCAAHTHTHAQNPIRISNIFIRTWHSNIREKKRLHTHTQGNNMEMKHKQLWH